MPAPPNPAFVFAVIGEEHVTALQTPLRFLRHFSTSEIVVVQGRSAHKATGARVIEISPPAALNNHQAALWLKTGLHKILAAHGMAGRKFCYLDSDVIAVAPTVDQIFDYDPVAFAEDHTAIDVFSHWGVHCGCRTWSCPHLREALFCAFSADVRDPCWTMWNGGVFLGRAAPHPLLDLWHRLTLASFEDPYFQTRDQGTLAAAVWSLDLQKAPVLPRCFNTILDCKWGLPDDARAVPTNQLATWRDFNLFQEIAAGHVKFMHLINQGVGRTGWRHWDEVAQLLPAPLSVAA